MKRTFLILLFAGLTMGASACLVSEADYEKLEAERDALQDKLTAAEKENTLLNQEILTIYKERETLLGQIELCRQELKAKEDARNQAQAEAASWQNKTFYEVRRGDTLSSIADRSGVSLDTLRRLNKLNNDVIWVGQRLRLRAAQ